MNPADIVERLRRRGRELTQVGDGTLQGLVLQAADEIERLRKINTKLQRDLSDRINDIFEHDAEIERLRAALNRYAHGYCGEDTARAALKEKNHEPG